MPRSRTKSEERVRQGLQQLNLPPDFTKYICRDLVTDLQVLRNWGLANDQLNHCVCGHYIRVHCILEFDTEGVKRHVAVGTECVDKFQIENPALVKALNALRKFWNDNAKALELAQPAPGTPESADRAWLHARWIMGAMQVVGMDDRKRPFNHTGGGIAQRPEYRLNAAEDRYRSTDDVRALRNHMLRGLEHLRAKWPDHATAIDVDAILARAKVNDAELAMRVRWMHYRVIHLDARHGRDDDGWKLQDVSTITWDDETRAYAIQSRHFCRECPKRLDLSALTESVRLGMGMLCSAACREKADLEARARAARLRKAEAARIPRPAYMNRVQLATPAAAISCARNDESRLCIAATRNAVPSELRTAPCMSQCLNCELMQDMTGRGPSAACGVCVAIQNTVNADKFTRAFVINGIARGVSMARTVPGLLRVLDRQYGADWTCDDLIRHLRP